MSKKHKKPQQDGAAPEQAAGETPQEVQPPPAEPQPSAEPKAVSKTMFWTFWGAIAVTVAAAWTLDAMLPNVPEHTIERWLMLAFGIFMAFFLVRLN
jgi:hypothetical protein